MEPQNGIKQEHQVLEARLDALKDGVSKLIDDMISKTAAKPSRFQAFTGMVTETIKAHPIATAAFALGFGYLVVRIVRR